ncbi:MAG: hypothetical protein ACXVXG_17650 [Nocardioidaceae bacterium]
MTGTSRLSEQDEAILAIERAAGQPVAVGGRAAGPVALRDRGGQGGPVDDALCGHDRVGPGRSRGMQVARQLASAGAWSGSKTRQPTSGDVCGLGQGFRRAEILPQAAPTATIPGMLITIEVSR